MLGVVPGLIWLLGSWKNRPPRDRPDIPYRAFTTEFDVVATGRDVPAFLQVQDAEKVAPKDTRTLDLSERIAEANEAYAEEKGSADWIPFRELLKTTSDSVAVVMLIDQSGSMRDRIVPLAGQIRFVSEEFAQVGVDLAILGFTTVGWKGGNPRLAWVLAGEKPYPGRLCALPHVVYK